MKEKVPLAILKALLPTSNPNLQFVSPVDDKGAVLVLKDKSPTSDFYFKIAKTEKKSTGLHFLLEYKPKSKGDTAAASNWGALDSTVAKLNTWLDIVGEYHTTISILDDPITKSYEDKFFAQFDIVDEDAAYAGFDLEQQLYIDKYLNGVRAKIQELKVEEGRSESEVAQLNAIEADAADIQKRLTNESKRSTIRRLARMWAKAQRVGLDVIKEIFVKVAAEIGAKLLTGRLQ